MCPNTVSPPSVPVVSSLITGTMFCATNAPWPVIRGTSMMLTSTSSPTFLNIIKPCTSDPSRYTRLLQGFPSSQEITQEPCSAPHGHKKNPKARPSPPVQTVPRPKTLPRVVLQRIEVPQEQLSLPSSPSRPSRERCWHSPSPTSHHPLGARNLREVETRMTELEREIHVLTRKITAAASELQVLCKSVSRLNQEQRD